MEVLVYQSIQGRIARRGSAASLSAASASLTPGTYTTLRTYGGDRVLSLEDHVARLNDPLRTMKGGPPPLRLADLRALVATAIREAGHAESRLRVTYAPPDLFVAVETFRPLPEALYEAGVWCVTTPLRRQNPHAKNTLFLDVAGAVYDALPPGAHEALMVAEDGSLLEGLSSNFFAVVRGVLHTEEDRVLPGLTRRLVLEATQGLLPCVPRAIRLEEVTEASECLLTSASREVLAVVRVDDVVVGDGRPGPVGLELLRRYRDTVWREARSVLD